MDASQARVLEIGGQTLIKRAFPDRTTLLWTGRKRLRRADRLPSSAPQAAHLDCTPARFIQAMRDVHAGRYDLVVTYLPLYSTWHPREGVRALFGDPWHPWRALTRVHGTSWLRAVKLPVPLVAVDLNDHFGIRRPGFFLLDKADAVFKRELPVDRWQVLTGTAHPALPTLRVRSNPRWIARMEKLRPISLAAPRVDAASTWEGEFPEKTADIFFSGNTTLNSWVRRAGIVALKQLAEHGIKVDIPDQVLPPPEFYKRMARSWLAWSPSGFGWDCYRTSEAAQCLTVPVVNHPTIERYRPLLQGEHLIQYDIEADGLLRAVQAALADKARLKQMAVAAREHVTTHLSLPALARHIIETGLSFKKTDD